MNRTWRAGRRRIMHGLRGHGEVASRVGGTEKSSPRPFHHGLPALVACAVAFVMSASVPAQGPQTDATKPFNGTSLAGWQPRGTAQWRVASGEIVGSATSGPGLLVLVFNNINNRRTTDSAASAQTLRRDEAEMRGNR